jgi:hypothetical protein
MANEFIQWLAGLEREYVFLLALPFVVAIVGLWSWWVDKDEIDREYEASARQAADGERRQRERRQGERRRAENSQITA